MSIEINLLTNVITNYLQTHYKMDNMALQLVSAMAMKIMNNAMTIYNSINFKDKDNIQFVFKNYNRYKSLIYKIILISLFRYNLVHIKKFKTLIMNRYNNKVTKSIPAIKPIYDKEKKIIKYKKIDINNIVPVIHTMNQYIKLNPDMFSTEKVGKSLYIDSKGNPLDIYDGYVHFNDTIHNVKGYITTKYDITIVKNEEVISYNMEIHIQQPSNKYCYVNQIQNYVKKHYTNGNFIQLNYFKVLTDSLVEYKFYESDSNRWIEDKKKLRNEFFSEHKEYLFNSLVDNKTSDISSTAWSNLILHGPPGTGKSSFVHRIAVSLKMDILSIDMSLYMDKKKELFSLFHKQNFALPSSKRNISINNKYIIILDEFDACIEKLIMVEKIYEYKKVITDNQYSKRGKFIDTKKEKSIKLIETEDSAVNTAVDNAGVGLKHIDIEDVNNGEIDMKSIMMSEMDNNQAMSQFEKGFVPETDEDKNSRNETRQYSEDIINVNGEIDFILKNINEENKSDVLRLSDLLELFQGPIPIKDRLIIATTNNFEKIKNVLPPLFRSGRLTPLKFGYLEWESFVELCEYFYSEDPGEEFVINIPTSQIIEIVNKNDSSFGNFRSEVYELSSIAL